MIRSAIRFIVHALFGVGVLSAFGVSDGAQAGKIGEALAVGAVKVGARAVTRQLRGSADTDQAASATGQSQSPKVLNRWDMQRKSDEVAQPETQSSTDSEHERAPGARATAPVQATGPVVVTVPNASAATGAPAVATTVSAATAVPAQREIAENQVVCIAGCR
jgi:hypothetical protein